jgi:hypothetical protein
MSVNLSQLLIKPELVATLEDKDWSRLIPYARAHGVLGRLFFLLEDNGLISSVPEKPLKHLKALATHAEQQKINTYRELDEISKFFAKKGIYPVILKGAAYLYRGYTCAKGRTFSDIDVMVDKSQMGQAEIALMVGGWIHKKEDEYDKEYYRKWTHEIQPMIHNHRLSIVDLHHNVLPPTNRDFFDSKRLQIDLDEAKNIATLTPCDLYLHCALHLFTEGEFSKPLRDITDLAMILNDTADTLSVDDIVKRGQELEIQDYINLALYLSLPFSKRPICQREKVTLNFWQSRLWVPVYSRIFYNNQVVSSSLSHKLCSFLLFVRGHYIRMPLSILIPHLLKKWLKKNQDSRALGKDWN